jgi:hypothetical protein
MSAEIEITTPPPVVKTLVKKKTPKPMSLRERKERFRGIKRYYRERMHQNYALNSPEYRQAREYLSFLDRIGAEDLEPFLHFLGLRIPKSTIQMWTEVQKVDILLDNLSKYREKANNKT